MKRLICCLAVAAAWPSTAAVTARACDGPVATYQSAPAFSYQGEPYYTSWRGYGDGYRPYYRSYGFRSYRWGYRSYYGYGRWGHRPYSRFGWGRWRY
jgi:hypothetical protein